MINNKMYFNNEILKNESREQKCQFEECIYYNNHSSVSMFIAAVSVVVVVDVVFFIYQGKIIIREQKDQINVFFLFAVIFQGPVYDFFIYKSFEYCSSLSNKKRT